MNERGPLNQHLIHNVVIYLLLTFIPYESKRFLSTVQMLAWSCARHNYLATGGVYMPERQPEIPIASNATGMYRLGLDSGILTFRLG